MQNKYNEILRQQNNTIYNKIIRGMIENQDHYPKMKNKMTKI